MMALSPEEQEKLFKRLKKIRDVTKNINYSAQYGAGPPKMAKTGNISLDQAKDLHKTYWKRNWAVKEVASQQKVITVQDQMWLVNPVNGFCYSLRNMKDVFSTLVQGTASYVFDVWVGFLRLRDIRLSATFHDEMVSKIKIGSEEETEKKCFEAIEDTNNYLNLNRRLDISVQTGFRYSEIH